MQIEITVCLFSFFLNTPNSSFIHFRLDLHVEHFITTASTDTHAAVSRDWQNWDVELLGGSEEVNESAVLLC